MIEKAFWPVANSTVLVNGQSRHLPSHPALADEVERDVVWCHQSIPNGKPKAAQQMVAVRLDKDLQTGARHLPQKPSNGRLSAGVKMCLGTVHHHNRALFLIAGPANQTSTEPAHPPFVRQG